MEERDEVITEVVHRMNLGRQHVQDNAFEAAVGEFTAVIGLVPGYAMAYFDRATAWMLRGDPSAAMTDFSRAIVLLPPDDEARAVAYSNRALAYEQRGDLAQAIEDLEEAEADGFAHAARELARIRGQYGEVAERSGTERARLAAGLCEDARRGFTSAPLDSAVGFQRASDLDPASVDAWHGLGIALAALGDREGAADAFGHVVRQAPTRAPLRAEALFNRSQMYDGLGDVEAAIEDLEECVALCQSGVAFPMFGDPEKEAIFREEMVAKLERLRRDDD